MKSFKTTYSRPAHAGLKFSVPSLVQPQFARDTDINRMIQRALGGDPSVFARGGRMVDVSNAPEDVHEVMNIIARGDTAWADLPDSVRRSYGSKEAFINAVVAEEQRVKSMAEEPVVENKEVKKEVTPSGAKASTPQSAE